MLAGGVPDDVGHDPHARCRRVDVGVADHELLEDVVLDGPRELLDGHALLLTGDDEAGQHREHGAVHGHRHRHLLERDAVEEDLHVLDRVDRHAGLADVAHDAGVIRVVAAVGGEVEGHREALLACREVASVEGVGLLGGGEARVLADRPRPVGVHRGPRAAGVGREAGQRAGVEAVGVGCGVEGLDVDPLGGVPDEGVGVGALEVLGRRSSPVFEVNVVEFVHVVMLRGAGIAPNGAGDRGAVRPGRVRVPGVRGAGRGPTDRRSPVCGGPVAWGHDDEDGDHRWWSRRQPGRHHGCPPGRRGHPRRT